MLPRSAVDRFPLDAVLRATNSESSRLRLGIPFFKGESEGDRRSGTKSPSHVLRAVWLNLSGRLKGTRPLASAQSVLTNDAGP